MQGVDLFITITDRSRAEQFAAWFRTHGISLVLTALGQGTATTEVLDFLGLEATEKAVLFCVSPRPLGWCARRPVTCGWMCPARAF